MYAPNIQLRTCMIHAVPPCAQKLSQVHPMRRPSVFLGRLIIAPCHIRTLAPSEQNAHAQRFTQTYAAHMVCHAAPRAFHVVFRRSMSHYLMIGEFEREVNYQEQDPRSILASILVRSESVSRDEPSAGEGRFTSARRSHVL